MSVSDNDFLTVSSGDAVSSGDVPDSGTLQLIASEVSDVNTQLHTLNYGITLIIFLILVIYLEKKIKTTVRRFTGNG